MRDDIILPATARRLSAAGLGWEPAIGDWCVVLGAEHVAEAQGGLWLVAARFPAAGLLALADAAGQWPITQVAARECLWMPTAGQLKTWLRARGYRIASGESPALLLGGDASLRHVCRLTRAGNTTPIDGEGAGEAEAVADAILRLLGAGTADERGRGW
ncbi:MAG TPA: hypothetical protein VKQ30_08320 [Ktedonobacterales bacterium]|nr:hypothetical protein [Ktedonobacterales bacterium]